MVFFSSSTLFVLLKYDAWSGFNGAGLSSSCHKDSKSWVFVTMASHIAYTSQHTISLAKKGYLRDGKEVSVQFVGGNDLSSINRQNGIVFCLLVCLLCFYL